MAQISPEQVFLRLTDQGPGIPDIEKAMTPGYSTASQEVREMVLVQVWDCLIFVEMQMFSTYILFRIKEQL